MTLKTLSLILIIIMLGTCVFALFGDALTEPFISSSTNIRDHAFTVDQLGNIFFIRSGQDSQSLVVLDSTGGQLLSADITENFASPFFVDSIYVLQNKNIWITGYSFDSETLVINGVKIAAFREDGSFIEDIYADNSLSIFKDNAYRKLSSFDEDERSVYFAIRAVSGESRTLSTYLYMKDGSEELRKTGEFQPDSGISAGFAAFHALSGGGILVSYTDGSLEMESTGGREIISGANSPGGAVFTKFLSGAGVVYMYDAAGGAIYSTPVNQLRPAEVISGSFTARAEDGIRFRDMHEISVSGVGNVLGVIHTQTGSDLYLGGFSFLPRIAEVSRIKSAVLTDWLIIIAVIAGIIISSILLWEFFVKFMKMRMSMIIRQILVTALVIFIAFFALSKYILVPSVTESLSEAHRDRLGSDAEVLLAAVKTAVNDDSTDEAYSAFLEDFGSKYNTGQVGSEPIYAYLITQTGSSPSGADSSYILRASSDGKPPGIALNAFMPYPSVHDELSAATVRQERFMMLDTETGRQLAYLRQADFRIGGAATYLCVIRNMSELEGRISTFDTLVNVYLLISGLVLGTAVMLTIVFHVITLKRLSFILHRFALGNYEIHAKIRSGDETGEMFKHIVKLSDMLSDKDRSLNMLGTAYHRFIPERFLGLLGENRIENVSKDMQTRIEGAYVVLIRFEIAGGDPSDMFTNANYVLEHVVPAIAQYGGTVYGFTNNGFNGVFDKNALDALKAALYARDACKRLNASLSNERGITVDLRVALTKGDLTLGFIGDENRMEPVAISDTSLLAEELMRICYGSNVFIAASEGFYHDVKKYDVRIRRCGRTLVDDRAMDFYDVIDSDPPAISELKKSFAEKFELGVNLFEKGDYDNAGKMFIDIIKHSTGDGVARNYVYLCDYNRRNTDKQTCYAILQTESGTWKTEN